MISSAFPKKTVDQLIHVIRSAVGNPSSSYARTREVKWVTEVESHQKSGDVSLGILDESNKMLPLPTTSSQ